MNLLKQSTVIERIAMGTKAAKTQDKQQDGISKKIDTMSSKSCVWDKDPPSVVVGKDVLDTCCEDAKGKYMTKSNWVGTNLLDPWKMYHRIQPDPIWLESIKPLA